MSETLTGKGLRVLKKGVRSLLQMSVLGTAVPIAFGTIVSTFLYFRYRDDVDSLQNQYHLEQDSKAHVLVQEVQGKFQQIHHGLQTIASMPGIRRIDPAAPKVSPRGAEWATDAFEGIEQIYLSLSRDQNISEISISSLDMDPDKINPATGKAWAPFATFDTDTINRLSEHPISLEKAVKVGDVVVHQNRAIKKQLSFFQQTCPTKDKVTLLNYPAVMSEEVTIDDNQFFRATHDEQDRQGFVYSVPYYGSNGKLKGLISCVFLTKNLRDQLPNTDSAIVDTKAHFAIFRPGLGTAMTSATSVRLAMPDTSLMYSSASPIVIPDLWGRWHYWVGKPSADFWNREDVRLLRTTILIGLGVLWTGVFILITFMATIRKRQDQRLESLLRSSQEILFMSDENGKIIRVGGQIKKALGWETGDFIGVNLSLFVIESEREDFQAHLKRVTERQYATETAEFQIETLDDKFVWYEFTTANMSHLPEIGGVLISLKNVETRKHAEFMLRTAKDAAESANEAKSEFLSRMSHELRTPLNAILGFGQLLEMSPETVQDQESVGQILKAGRHLLNLVNDILDISKIESGTLTMSVEPVECLDVIETVVNFIDPQAKQAGISVHVEYDGDFKVLGDRQRMVQVLINLCTNAIKYNKPGGTVTINVKEKDEDTTAFQIRDTGIGINPQVIERLFTPFDRLGAEKLTIEGTGLGLALSKTLVDAMRGKIEVNSTLGVGTVMEFSLPTAKPELQVIEGGAEESPSANELEGATKVLYIEDNLANLKVIADLIQTMPNFELSSARQGGIGIEMVESYQPHIILLDLHLTDMSGLQVLEHIRTNPQTSNAKVIVLSAEVDPIQLEKAIFLGADYIHTKPINVKDLIDLLHDIAEAA